MTTRFALAIGNSKYLDADPVSGIKDAELMAQSLEKLDFDVTLVTNGKLDAMTKGFEQLGQKIGQASVVVVSFSGHGYQSSGENYLMPTNGTIDPASSVSLTAVRDALTAAPPTAIKLLFLDACRPEKKLSGGPHGLKTENAPALVNSIYAFAAASDQETPAGDPDSFSPYSEAILRYLRTPGLGIGEMLDKVSVDLAKIGLSPVALNQQVPGDFMLREPVTLQAVVTKADDDLFLLFGEDIALTASQSRQAKLTLKAGDNPFAILVANDKTYRNNHDWSVTEGWGYEMSFKQDGTGSTFNGLPLKEPGEDIPFKDGPHHGKVFKVASGNLFVDAEPKLATVAIRDLDTQVWQEKAPFYARSQAVLYEKSVAALPIDLNKVVANALNLGSLDPFLAGLISQVLSQLIQNGDLLGISIADPKKLFVLVLGNQDVSDLVQFCMNDQINARVADLETALAAALARKDRPFDIFDENLTKAVQEEARRRGRTDNPKPEEIKVWTALDDRSKP